MNTEENTRESERMSRTFMTIIERERSYENFMKIIKKVLVLVSQNAIRAKRSIQQQYNNQIIISFLIQPQPFYEQKILKNTQPSCKQIVDCIFYLYSCISKLYTKKVIYILGTKNTQTPLKTRQDKAKT